MSVKVIVAKQKHDMTHMLGQFPDESHYDHLIEEDTDVYMPEIPESLAYKHRCLPQ